MTTARRLGAERGQVGVVTIAARNYLASVLLLGESLARVMPDWLFTAIVIDATATELDALAHRWPSIASCRPSRSRSRAPPGRACSSTTTSPSTRRRSSPPPSSGSSRRQRSRSTSTQTSRSSQTCRCWPRARRHGVALTPHVTSPSPRDFKDTSEEAFLTTGQFNLGFIAVSNAGRALPRLLGRAPRAPRPDRHRGGILHRPALGRRRAHPLRPPHGQGPRLQRGLLEPPPADPHRRARRRRARRRRAPALLPLQRPRRPPAAHLVEVRPEHEGQRRRRTHAAASPARAGRAHHRQGARGRDPLVPLGGLEDGRVVPPELRGGLLARRRLGAPLGRRAAAGAGLDLALTGLRELAGGTDPRRDPAAGVAVLARQHRRPAPVPGPGEPADLRVPHLAARASRPSCPRPPRRCAPRSGRPPPSTSVRRRPAPTSSATSRASSAWARWPADRGIAPRLGLPGRGGADRRCGA